MWTKLRGYAITVHESWLPCEATVGVAPTVRFEMLWSGNIARVLYWDERKGVTYGATLTASRYVDRGDAIVVAKDAMEPVDGLTPGMH